MNLLGEPCRRLALPLVLAPRGHCRREELTERGLSSSLELWPTVSAAVSVYCRSILGETGPGTSLGASIADKPLLGNSMTRLL